ncbi:muconolactone Delta-isomerase family protein [Streptacidiphilus sp. MAP5-3]|uniref:muconolactone Delta-isomerase family protein n=1 Tax=unclassified Streptacidiphilus TaxID=2643834 RepID=UPI0035124835
MREFLVEMTTVIPEGTAQEEVDRRRAAERVRAGELAATGHLFRLWRPVGEARSIGVWCAEDEADLEESVLGTLPLRPWMTAVVTPLESHPNDPGLAGNHPAAENHPEAGIHPAAGNHPEEDH